MINKIDPAGVGLLSFSSFCQGVTAAVSLVEADTKTIHHHDEGKFDINLDHCHLVCVQQLEMCAILYNSASECLCIVIIWSTGSVSVITTVGILLYTISKQYPNNILTISDQAGPIQIAPLLASFPPVNM